MTKRPKDPIAIIWERLDELENKADGIFGLSIALFEHLLDKKVLTTEEVSVKLQSLYDSLHEPTKSSHTGRVIQVALEALRRSSPEARKSAIFELIDGGKSLEPTEPH